MNQLFDVDARLCSSLPSLGRLYRRSLDRALRDLGLTETTALPIQFLSHASLGLRHGKLAELMNIEGPTLVRVLDQLVAAGYVERFEDKKDRRIKIVRLTPAGSDFNCRLQQRLLEYRSSLFKGVNSEELELTEKVVNRVLANVVEGLDEPVG